MSLPALQTRKRWLVETDFWCPKRKRWIPIAFMASRSLTSAEIEAQEKIIVQTRPSESEGGHTGAATGRGHPVLSRAALRANGGFQIAEGRDSRERPAIPTVIEAAQKAENETAAPDSLAT